MKTRILSIVAVMVFTITTITAQSEKKEKMEVAGNCGMCKTRIENAAKSVDGVSSAEWNKETKILEVSYDSTKINIHKVHMAIAKAGHDTKMHKASDETYNQLPGCCRYERLTAEKNASHGSDGYQH
jgi:copper chaperone CopZ